MAYVIKSNVLAEGVSGETTLLGWKYLENNWLVGGCVAVGEAKFDEAIECAGVPQKGAAHPAYPALVLTNVRPRSTAVPDCVMLTLRWTRSAPLGTNTRAVIGVQTYDEEVASPYDVTGALIKVPWGGAYKNVWHRRLVSRVRIDASRDEDDYGLATALSLSGKVHVGSPWELDPSAADRTWRCTTTYSQTNTDGDKWACRYQFDYKADLPTGCWDGCEVYVDPTTGAPHDKVTGSEGYVRVVDHQSANFNILNLLD